MKLAAQNLWTLTRARAQIDPNDLAEAVAAQVAGDDLDYRTRMLIHDSVDALRHYWGNARLEQWLGHCAMREKIEQICREEFDKVGFPSLTRRVMDKTDPDDIRQYLEELGSELNHTVKLNVGGSIALILPEYISRHTEDIDVVDSVPDEIRNRHGLLDRLEKRYGLHLGHFQSHYLPMGWEARVHSLAPFGRLQVYLVDRYDVFISKLFSKRDKDRDDMRVLKPQLDKDVLVQKLKDHAQGFLSTPQLLQMAQTNWQILFGEPLPT